MSMTETTHGEVKIVFAKYKEFISSGYVRDKIGNYPAIVLIDPDADYVSIGRSLRLFGAELQDGCIAPSN